VEISATISGMEQADKIKVPYEIGFLRAMRMRQIMPATGMVASIGSSNDNIMPTIAKWRNGEVSDGGGHQPPESAKRLPPPPFAPLKSSESSSVASCFLKLLSNPIHGGRKNGDNDLAWMCA